MGYEISLDGAGGHAVTVTRLGLSTGATIAIDGRPHRCALAPDGDAFAVTVDDRTDAVRLVADRDQVHVHAFGRSFTLSVVDPVERERAAAVGADLATAPMPGTVVSVAVGVGDAVVAGQPLAVIESMKMHSEIVAWRDGTVESVLLAVGDTFDRGAGLLALVPQDADADGDPTDPAGQE